MAKEWDNQSLYEGSNITVMEVCLLILKHKSKHKDSIVAIEDWLALMRSFFPFANLPQSWEQLSAKIKRWGSSYKKIDVCKCMEHIYTGTAHNFCLIFIYVC